MPPVQYGIERIILASIPIKLRCNFFFNPNSLNFVDEFTYELWTVITETSSGAHVTIPRKPIVLPHFSGLSITYSVNESMS